MQVVIETGKPVHISLEDTESEYMIIELSPNAAPIRVSKDASVYIDENGQIRIEM